MILDTSFIIDFMDGDPKAVEKMNLLQDKRENIFVTSPTIFELWSGIARSKRPENEMKKVIEVIKAQLCLDLDQETAQQAGTIDGMLVHEGIQIDTEDCMIAGIAKKHNQTVLTRNIKHFGRIKDLKIETY